MPQFLFDKLQRLQNSAMRIVKGFGKFDNVSQSMLELHWLPAKARVEFKITLLVFKALHGKALLYITDMIEKTHYTS